MSSLNLQKDQPDVNYSALNTRNIRRLARVATYALVALTYALLVWNFWVFIGAGGVA